MPQEYEYNNNNRIIVALCTCKIAYNNVILRVVHYDSDRRRSCPYFSPTHDHCLVVDDDDDDDGDATSVVYHRLRRRRHHYTVSLCIEIHRKYCYKNYRYQTRNGTDRIRPDISFYIRDTRRSKGSPTVAGHRRTRDGKELFFGFFFFCFVRSDTVGFGSFLDPKSLCLLVGGGHVR